MAIINKGQLLFNGSPRDVISQYAQKRLVLFLKDGTSKEFNEHSQLGLNEILDKHKINLSDVRDMKIEEGKLEDAFSKMVTL